MTNSAQNAQAAAATAEDVVSVVVGAADIAAKLLPYAMAWTYGSYDVGPVSFWVAGSGDTHSIWANNNSLELLGLALASLDESGQFKSKYTTVPPSGGWARLDDSLTDFYLGVVTVAKTTSEASGISEMKIVAPIVPSAGPTTIFSGFTTSVSRDLATGRYQLGVKTTNDFRLVGGTISISAPRGYSTICKLNGATNQSFDLPNGLVPDPSYSLDVALEVSSDTLAVATTWPHTGGKGPKQAKA